MSLPKTAGSDTGAAFGAYWDDIPAGAAELTVEEGYVSLNFILVTETRRRAGIGSALLDQVKEFAAEMDVDRIVAEFVSDFREEEAVKAFFRDNGFYLSESSDTGFVLSPAGLMRLELFQKAALRGLPDDAGHQGGKGLHCKRELSQQQYACNYGGKTALFFCIAKRRKPAGPDDRGNGDSAG